MPTSAAGSNALCALLPVKRYGRWRDGGFTLIELLVVISLIAIATATASLALRDSASTALEREAQRMAAMLESLRAQSRANDVPATVHFTNLGMVVTGLSNEPDIRPWSTPHTLAISNEAIVLGPEPLLPAQTITLQNTSQPSLRISVLTDGLHPWTIGRLQAPSP